MPLPTRGLQADQPQRRSEELVRAPSAALRREATVGSRRTPFDPAGIQPSGLSSQGFGGNLPELLPLDMSLAGASPDSAGTPGGVHRQSQGFQQGRGPSSSASSLYKLDAMMFPSTDPFAYPNQPLLDTSGYHHGRPGGGQGQDTQFYMPNVYDDIEGQLLGPIPPYLVPQGHAHHAMDPASQVYNTPNIPAVQHGHGAETHQQQRHSQQQQGQHRRNQQQQQQQQQHQQQDMMEDVLVDPSFQGDWDNILGGTTGYR